MKNTVRHVITGLTVLCMILISFGVNAARKQDQTKDHVKAGFLYVGDAATSYTANFIRAENYLKSEFGDQVETVSLANVSEANSETALRTLADEGCDIIFATSYGFGEAAKKVAFEYPEIQFCQATCDNANTEPVLDNYHTFMGEIYEGRYVTGVIAGLKLRELLRSGIIREDEAVAGYVAAMPAAEVISGYTAFFLGIRSIVPDARMKVRYSGTWSEYAVEYQLAEQLIDEGCVIISQHSDTIGPAVACEEARERGTVVYHVGYNQSMTTVAPSASLTSSRINWIPYVTGAVKAVMQNEKIEDAVEGHVHGNDIGAGFADDWVQIVEINESIAAKGSTQIAESLIEQFRNGEIEVFKGSYTGVNPSDPADTIDLSQGYQENALSSAPRFCYVLDDVIEVE